MLNYNYYAALGFLRLLLVSCSSCCSPPISTHETTVLSAQYVAALITYTTTELLEQHLPYSCLFEVTTTPYNGHNIMLCFAGGYGWILKNQGHSCAHSNCPSVVARIIILIIIDHIQFDTNSSDSEELTRVTGCLFLLAG